MVNFIIVDSIPNERETLRVLSIANGGELIRTIYIQEFAALSWLDAVNCRSASSAEVKTHFIYIIVILCVVCVVVLLVQQLGLMLHHFNLQFDERIINLT